MCLQVLSNTLTVSQNGDTRNVRKRLVLCLNHGGSFITFRNSLYNAQSANLYLQASGAFQPHFTALGSKSHTLMSIYYHDVLTFQSCL